MGTLVLIGIAGLMALAAAHSVAGEIMLLRPMFLAGRNPVVEHPLARAVLRFAWHLTSLSWVALAFVLHRYAVHGEAGLTEALRFAGACFVVAGLADLWMSRGRHYPWVVIVATGLAFWFAAGVQA